jgi:hypothetical protein
MRQAIDLVGKLDLVLATKRFAQRASSALIFDVRLANLAERVL